MISIVSNIFDRYLIIGGNFFFFNFDLLLEKQGGYPYMRKKAIAETIEI